MKGLPFHYRVAISVEQIGAASARREVVIEGAVRSPDGIEPGHQVGLKVIRRALHDCANQIAKRRAARP